MIGTVVEWGETYPRDADFPEASVVQSMVSGYSGGCWGQGTCGHLLYPYKNIINIMERRHFLVGSATATVAALAGCGSPDDDSGSDDGGGEETTDEPGGYSLHGPRPAAEQQP